MRVFLVDDNVDFLRSAMLALEEEGYAVVGRALNGREALSLIRSLELDVVLLELAMTRMNGFELTRRIKRLSHPPAVIATTLNAEAEFRYAAERAGADRFVEKERWFTELPGALESIRAVRKSWRARRGGGSRSQRELLGTR